MPGDAARPVVAAFDVDGTVTTHDCVVPFLRRVAGTPRLVGALGRSARHVVPAAVRRDRDALKAQASRAAFRGKRYADVEASAAEFAADLHHGGLRPDVLDRLAWHRRAGHHSVLVSASFAVYLRPLAAGLGVDDVLATELEVVDDRCTGELVGGNCRGPEKVARLHRWLDAHHGGRAAVEVWAYGDSPGDRELLADADHAVWVADRVTAVPEDAFVSVAAGLLRTARPKQWLKNVLVFAAPGAAGVLDQPADLAKTLLAFVAFCLAASGIYMWNDALDVESDRLHPTKRFRPVPAGIVSVTTAKVVGTVLTVLALGVAALTGRWQTVAVVATYVAIVTLYSAWLKHVAVLDIVTVASGFVLRAAGGAVAVHVPMSDWFVLVTVFGSLFIVTGKRYAEMREVGEDAAAVRTTLAAYNLGYLRIVLAVSCGAALLSYCQWAFQISNDVHPRWPFYQLSIVPMLTALLRYALVLEQGRGAAPEEVFASDRVLQLLGVAWAIVFGLAVYIR